jgi:hypothetical protein
MVSRVSKVSETRRDNKSSHFARANVDVNFSEADKLTRTVSFSNRKISWITVYWSVYILGIGGIGY